MDTQEMPFDPEKIVVVGASGGLGAALCVECVNRFPSADKFSLSRTGVDGGLDDTEHVTLDFLQPETIAAAADRVGSGVDLVLVTTGLLHAENLRPEKSLRDLEPGNLELLFAINAIGPALVMKHFLPLMRRDRRSVFAALSARVGSITDNRLGGWYGYRASKAALNQMIKTASIEQKRKHPHCCVVGLHPGTVDTGLSKPFQGNVPQNKLFSAELSATHLLDVISGLFADDSGKVFDWKGDEVPA